MIFFLFFSQFSCSGRVWTEFGTKIFFSLSWPLIPFWLKIMLERVFFIFLLVFSEFYCPGLEWTEFGTNFFFFCRSWSISSRFGKKECQKRVLKFFEFFCYFFRNFLPRAEYERNSGQKVFPRFLSLCHLVLAKNNGGKSFFNFFDFFFYFFRNFLARVKFERNLGLNFFSLFLGLS